MKITRDKKGKSRLILPRDYCVVDIETTGLSPSDCEIIEISAVRYRGLRREAVYSTLVKPSRSVPRLITELTGITNEMVTDAADIRSAVLGFRDFVGEDIILGYNVSFDINFLYDALMREGFALSNDFVDVLRLARRALPEIDRHSQTKVAEYIGIDTSGAHRAEFDCELCNAIYQRVMNSPGVTEAVENI